MTTAARSSEYLEELANRVASFKEALLSFVELHERNEAEFGPLRVYLPNITPKPRASKRELQRRREAVSEAAGWAAEASSVLRNGIDVSGAGRLNPIRTWQTITMPKPLLELNDILDYCTQSIGELRMRAYKEKALDDAPAGFTELHPSVVGAAAPLWENRHFRESVSAASNAVVSNLKSRIGRNDITETALWKETFSDSAPQPGKPRLRWPGDADDQTTRTMAEGLRNLSSGVQMVVRNPAIHSTEAYRQQDALEQLNVLSFLARLVDQCEVVTVELLAQEKLSHSATSVAVG